MLARLAAALEYLAHALIAAYRSPGSDPTSHCIAVSYGFHFQLLLELPLGGVSLLELLLPELSSPELSLPELLSVELDTSLEPESSDDPDELSSDDDSEELLPLEELGGQTVYVYSSPMGQSTGTQISREVIVKQPFSSSDTFVMIVMQLHGSPEPEEPLPLDEELLDELSLPLEEDSLLEDSTDELDSDDSLLELSLELDELSLLELSLEPDELSLLESEELLSEELPSEELLSEELDPSGQQSTSFS